MNINFISGESSDSIGFQLKESIFYKFIMCNRQANDSSINGNETNSLKISSVNHIHGHMKNKNNQKGNYSHLGEIYEE